LGLRADQQSTIERDRGRREHPSLSVVNDAILFGTAEN